MSVGIGCVLIQPWQQIYFVGALLLVITPSDSQSDTAKWVWGRNDNVRVLTNEKRYNGDSLSKPLFQANANYNGDRGFSNLKYRYEVTEPTYPPENTYRPRPDQYRPDPLTNRPLNPYRPPVNSIDNYRPTNRPFENEYRPLGNGYQPPNPDYYLHGLRPGVGTNGRPILTGPTPSWEDQKPHKYRDYDICKCVHSFNCNTPGIKFGSCDADKQYCCYKSKQNENEKPVANGYETPRPRPVLAGPGGPVDGFAKPAQHISSGRPQHPNVDSDRELNEAYKKGLASAIHELYQRPSPYYDREFQGYQEYNQRYSDNTKSSHPSKYGLYYPSVRDYARSGNTTITAISDSKN